MEMTRIIPIILSGGAGTRLWPISRRMHPKPFMEVAGKPLLAHALERAALIADEALIVTNQDHYFLTENLLKETPKAPKVSYLLEPRGRNTAPAIALAVRHIQMVHGDETVCLVLATDHLISDDAPFERAVGHAQEQVQEGNLVVFGIRPTAPETGYGYLEVAAAGDGPQALSSFVEKPDRKTAEQYLAEGRYYWNSGMFCFTAGVMADNMAAHADEVWTASEAAFAEAQENAGVTRFEEDSFIAQPDISIDYAVMEKSDKIAMVPAGLAGPMSAAGMLWLVHMTPMLTRTAIVLLVSKMFILLKPAIPILKAQATRRRLLRLLAWKILLLLTRPMRCWWPTAPNLRT